MFAGKEFRIRSAHVEFPLAESSEFDPICPSVNSPHSHTLDLGRGRTPGEMPYTSKTGKTVPDFSVKPHQWVHGELSDCKLCKPCVTACALLVPCAVGPLSFAAIGTPGILLNEWPASHFLSSCAGRVHGVRKVQVRPLHGALRVLPEAVQAGLRAPHAVRGRPSLLCRYWNWRRESC